MSPTNSQPKENDWQIVMPLKNTSNSSDPASEKSQPDEDVFISDDKLQNTTNISSASTGESAASSMTLSSVQLQATSSTTAAPTRPMQSPPAPLGDTSTTSSDLADNSQPQPPPPSYSVAITRHLDNKASASTTGSSAKQSVSTTNPAANLNQQEPVQQQQQLDTNLVNDLDDSNGRAGILPAARARLASLKSLGSKKLNAIKMRLSDNRQKIEECKFL